MAALRWAGLVLGTVVGVIAAESGGLGTGLLLAAPLFGLCVLLGVIGGELLVRAPTGPTRTAAVEVRRVGDYLPSRLGPVVAATGIALLALVVVTTAAGSPDDQGRAGRSLFRQCTADISVGHGPWPGWSYTGPLAAVVLAGLVVAAVALHVVVRRPRTGEDRSADDRLRRRSARTVTGAVGILFAIPLAGVSLTAAGALFGIDCAPAWWTVAGYGLIALVPAALVVVAWCAIAVLTPASGSDEPARAR